MLLVCSVGMGPFWLIASTMAFVPIFFLPDYLVSRTSLRSSRGDALILGRQETLLSSFKVIMPVQQITYLAAMWGFIDAPATIFVCQIIAIIRVGTYLSVAMDDYSNLKESRLRLKAEVNATAARRSFMKFVFHETRTPLNSLRLGIYYLQTTEPSSSALATTTLDEMAQACAFIENTMDNVLSMQKIEEGKLELALSSFSFKQILSNVVAIHKGSLKEKKIRLSVETTPSCPLVVTGDPRCVTHIFSNLLSNAIKFSPRNGAVLISVETVAQEKGSFDFVRISFTDDGPGIEEHDQAMLFENFMQISPEQLQNGKGSGLGLALVKQLVLLHGGRVSVSSKIGQGSTFSVTIPFKILPAVEASIDSLDERALTLQVSSPRAVSDLRILIVDDSAVNVKMLDLILKRKGLLTASSSNGKEALDKILRNQLKFKLVLLDNSMPVMSGPQAATAMRRASYPFFIVGLTGNVLEDDVDDFLSAGADIVLPKPLKIHMLEMVINFAILTGMKSRPGMTLKFNGNCVEWETRPLKPVKKNA